MLYRNATNNKAIYSVVRDILLWFARMGIWLQIKQMTCAACLHVESVVFCAYRNSSRFRLFDSVVLAARCSSKIVLPATVRRFEAKALSAEDSCFRQFVLGSVAAAQAWMEAGGDSRSVRDRCSLASGRIQAVLDLAFAASAPRRKKVHYQGIARVDLSYGCRESHLGRATIHGELKMLGLDISERSVLRWMRKAPRNPEFAKRRSAFLSNHRKAIAQRVSSPCLR